MLLVIVQFEIKKMVAVQKLSFLPFPRVTCHRKYTLEKLTS